MEYIDKPKGATKSEINSISTENKIELSQEFENWFQISNGPTVYFGYKEIQFFSANEIIGKDIYQLKQYMPSSLPMCLDGSGNICVAKIESGIINGFYVSSCGNLGWEDAVLISKTFNKFVNDTLSPENRLLNG